MENKVAFITGASCGIGAAFARYLAEKRYDLIITSLPDDEYNAYAEKLRNEFNINIEIIPADFAREDDIAKVETAIRNNSRIEFLVNNAGFVFWKPFMQKNIEDLEKMIKVHINAPVRFIYAALPQMILKKKGIIINLSSLSSFMPIPLDSMYSATKLFQNSFMESLHISVRDKGIKVQVICPGFVRSHFHERAGVNLTSLKYNRMIRWMEPDEVVRISVRNLKKRNKVIVIPGFRNKVIRIIATGMPRSLYYSFARRYLQ